MRLSFSDRLLFGLAAVYCSLCLLQFYRVVELYVALVPVILLCLVGVFGRFGGGK